MRYSRYRVNCGKNILLSSVLFVCLVYIGCAKSSGGGGSSDAPAPTPTPTPTPTPPPTYKHFIYLTQAGDDNVATYEINTTTGALTAGSNQSVGNEPYGMCAHPDGLFMYVSNYADNTITALQISAAGTFSAVSGSPYATATTRPYHCAVSPNGSFLYVSHYNNLGTGSISAYSINQSTGALSAVSGSPFVTDNFVHRIVISADSAYLYHSSFGGDLRSFSINASTGALTETSGSPLNVTYTANDIMLNPAGTLLYAIQGSFGRITRHSVNASNGTLGAEVGANSANEDYYGGCMTPDGNFLYATDFDNFLAPYSVAGGGALTPLTKVTYGGGTTPISCVTTEDSGFIYVNGYDNNQLYGYSIDSGTGALSALAGTPYTTGNDPTLLVRVKREQ